jgi:heme-degrading monooxygenase HmoA
MSQVASQTIIVVGEESFGKLLEIHNLMLASLQAVDGFQSLTLWKDADFQDQYRWLSVHGTHEAAIAGMTAWAESEGIERLSVELQTAPSMMVQRIEYRHGSDPNRTTNGQAMSVSVRRADLGMGYQLEAEIADVFENMTYMDGYLGAFYGPSTSMEEEFIGVVFWTNRVAFERSLPQRPPYELRLLERIA